MYTNASPGAVRVDGLRIDGAKALLKRVGEAPRQLGLDLPIRDAGVDEGVRPAGEVGHQRVRVGVVDQTGA